MVGDKYLSFDLARSILSTKEKDERDTCVGMYVKILLFFESLVQEPDANGFALNICKSLSVHGISDRKMYRARFRKHVHTCTDSGRDTNFLVHTALACSGDRIKMQIRGTVWYRSSRPSLAIH